MRQQNINYNFFQGIYREIWRQMIPVGLTEAEGDFIVDVANLSPGDRLLDLMCGYGRHTRDLSGRGINVMAVDNAPAYIEEVMLAATKEALPVEAICADILDLSLKRTFDAVICMGNSFAFFDREESMLLLKKIAGHLKDGGIFILNSWMIAEIAIRHFKEKEWHRVGNYKYLLDNRFEFYPSRIESEHTIVGDNGRLVETINGIDYIFTLAELEEMFQHAGLTATALYSTPRKKKFVMGDGRIYIVIKKIS